MKVAVGIALTGIIHQLRLGQEKKQIPQRRRNLDAFLMTYRIKVANTHHRIDIRYP